MESPDSARSVEERAVHKPHLPIEDSSRILALVFDGVRDGLCILDCEYTIVRVNRFMEEAYRSEMPLVGRKCYEAYHHRAEPCEICPTRQTYATGRPAIEEVPYETGGRTVGSIELSSHPVFDDNGRVAGVVEYVKYITDRKLAQDALRESEARYKTLFQNALAGVCRAQLSDGLVIEANDSFARMLGYSGREEIVGSLVLSELYVEPADRRRLVEELRRDKELVAREVHLRRKDGSTVWLRTYMRLEPGSGYIEGITSDVTAEKQALEALRLTQYSVDNAVDAIYWVNREGRFVYANAAACRLYGYACDELLALHVRQTDVVTQDFPSWQEEWTQGTAEEPMHYVTDKRRKDGKVFPAELTIKHVVFGDTEYRYVFARDISARLELEAQLRQAQKMEAVGRLAGGVAHDFNNILQGILGAAELSLSDASPSDRHYGELAEIRQGTWRAAELTGQLLAFSRRQILRASDVDFNRVVSETTKMLRRLMPETITLRTSLSAAPSTVHADATQMQQVILNICLNARDAMPGGGVLTLETAAVTLDDTYCALHLWARPGRYLLFSATDTGAGMDPSVVAHVFEPFFTTKEPGRGTGLGLPIVYGIVKQHNGMVSAYSEPGRGTTIKVYLPLVERAPTEADVVQASPPQDGTETVLVAEDNDMSRGLAKKILEQFGYTVILAGDGQEAVDLFRRNSEKVDVVFLDLIMPRMSGEEAFLRMLETKPGLKAVFSTGYSVTALQNGLSQFPGVKLLQKPYPVDELLHAVRAVLDTPAHQEE